MAAKGVALGASLLHRAPSIEIANQKIENTQSEQERFSQAVNSVDAQLGEHSQRLFALGYIQESKIFSSQQTMLRDVAFEPVIREHISQHHESAEQAVITTCQKLIVQFGMIKNHYIRQRRLDIEDISMQILIFLKQFPVTTYSYSKSYVVVAQNITPHQLLLFAPRPPSAMVIADDMRHSHTVLLAQAFNIPTVVGCDIDNIESGLPLLVDGNRGLVILEPNRQHLRRLERYQYPTSEITGETGAPQ